MSTPPECLYCGKTAIGVKKGEHVVPKAIGGTDCLANVCTTCNNGPLSRLDDQLCTRSPLSIVASQELRSDIAEMWDVDKANNNLLLDAVPDWDVCSSIVLPQMIFDDGRTSFYGSTMHTESWSHGRLEGAFVRLMREAYHNFRFRLDAKPKIVFRPVLYNRRLLNRFRYPPRLVAKNLLKKAKPSFELRYVTPRDSRTVLQRLSDWTPLAPFRRWETTMGAEESVLRFSFNSAVLVRGLVKIGINLRAFATKRTKVG